MFGGWVPWVVGRGSGCGREASSVNHQIDLEALQCLLERALFYGRSASFYVERLSGAAKEPAVACCAGVLERLYVLQDIFSDDGEPVMGDDSDA